MEQMGREVKQTGSGDKDHVLSLSFCIIPPEKPFVFMIQLKKEHFFFAVWTLQRVITHGEQKTIAPGIKIKDYPVF